MKAARTVEREKSASRGLRLRMQALPCPAAHREVWSRDVAAQCGYMQGLSTEAGS